MNTLSRFDSLELLYQSKIFEFTLVSLTSDKSHILDDLVFILFDEDVLPEELDEGLLEEFYTHFGVIFSEN